MKKIQISEIFFYAKKNLRIGVSHGTFYQKCYGNWKKISEPELTLQIRKLFTAEVRGKISTACTKEVVELLRQDPDLQLDFVDSTEIQLIKVKNGIFDAGTDTLLEDTGALQFSYCMNFEYLKPDKRELKTFNDFCISAFPEFLDEKRTLLLQMFGYVMSDFRCAKAGFFMIGESNSGKSVLLDFLKNVFPEKTVTAIPLYRLENRFNLARLSESRLNINAELTEKSFNALDIFKMLTANDTVTAEHKGGKPFEFQIKCKTINAGNLLPDLKTLEGMEAVVNRMILLLFPVSIAKENQDKHLLDKLLMERDSICSEALDSLYDLRKNEFVFTEPDDTIRLKNQLFATGNAFEDFVKERCIFKTSEREYMADLFSAFLQYCEDNLMEVKLTRTQFSQRVYRLKYVEKGKFRINGGTPRYGVKGLRLKNIFEYDKDQDSEMSDAK